MAHIDVIHEVCEEMEDGWRLCLHWGCYHYDDGRPDEYGYRFMWRWPDGSLQAARGQARIPSLEVAERLMRKARDAGWGGHDAGASHMSIAAEG